MRCKYFLSHVAKYKSNNNANIVENIKNLPNNNSMMNDTNVIKTNPNINGGSVSCSRIMLFQP